MAIRCWSAIMIALSGMIKIDFAYNLPEEREV